MLLEKTNGGNRLRLPAVTIVVGYSLVRIRSDEKILSTRVLVEFMLLRKISAAASARLACIRHDRIVGAYDALHCSRDN